MWLPKSRRVTCVFIFVFQKNAPGLQKMKLGGSFIWLHQNFKLLVLQSYPFYMFLYVLYLYADLKVRFGKRLRKHADCALPSAIISKLFPQQFSECTNAIRYFITWIRPFYLKSVFQTNKIFYLLLSSLVEQSTKLLMQML